MAFSVRCCQRIVPYTVAICVVIWFVIVIRFGVEKALVHFRRVSANEILASIPSRYRVVGKSTQASGFDGISVHLIDTKISDEEMFYIGTLEEIVILDLSGTPVGPQGLRHCTSLSELQQLHLARTSLGESVWSVVEHFPNLTVLDVAETHVTGEQVPDSLSLRHLKILHGDDARITDAGLEKICRACPYLESLSISGTNVSSDASKFLNPLRGLGALSINDTNTDDCFIGGLSREFLTNLRVLRVRSTAISSETIRQLQIDYPWLHIDLRERQARFIHSDMHILATHGIDVCHPKAVVRSLRAYDSTSYARAPALCDEARLILDCTPTVCPDRAGTACHQR